MRNSDIVSSFLVIEKIIPLINNSLTNGQNDLIIQTGTCAEMEEKNESN